MSRQDETIDITVHVHHSTPRAILVSEDGEQDGAVWLPLSQIEGYNDETGQEVIIELPEWLARAKGLL